MEHNNVHRLLMQYNDELFYKELFMSRNNHVRYAKLMENFNLDAANRRQLIIPEFRTGGYRPTRFGDESFEIIYVLSGKCENNIFGSTDILKQGDLCDLFDFQDRWRQIYPRTGTGNVRRAA